MLWQTVKKAWDEYPLDKVARAFVHHAQVTAAIYDCEGGDEFVQERNGLSFAVRKVCRLFYGDEYEGEEDGRDLTDLTSLVRRDEVRVPQGVIIDDVPGTAGAVDLEDGGGYTKLKYPVPDISEHDIAQYLSYGELALIAGDPEDVDYENLSDAQKTRYDKFVEAWHKKQDALGKPRNPQSTKYSADVTHAMWG